MFQTRFPFGIRVFFRYILTMATNIKKTPFINLVDVQEYCGLSRNITEKEYNKFIISVQNLNLRKILGKDLLNLIGTEVCSGNPSESTEDIMEDFLIGYICFMSFSHYAGVSTNKNTKQGIVKITGDNSESLNRNETNKEVSFNQKQADFYAELLEEMLEEDYLLDEVDRIYPLYESKIGCSPLENATIFSI